MDIKSCTHPRNQWGTVLTYTGAFIICGVDNCRAKLGIAEVFGQYLTGDLNQAYEMNRKFDEDLIQLYVDCCKLQKEGLARHRNEERELAYEMNEQFDSQGMALAYRMNRAFDRVVRALGPRVTYAR